MESDQLKAWRKSWNLTQKEAAEVLKVNLRTYQGMESRYARFPGYLDLAIVEANRILASKGLTRIELPTNNKPKKK